MYGCNKMIVYKKSFILLLFPIHDIIFYDWQQLSALLIENSNNLGKDLSLANGKMTKAPKNSLYYSERIRIKKVVISHEIFGNFFDS